MTTYYTPTGNPIDLSRGTSSLVRNEFILIQTAFNSVDSTFTSVNALIGTKGNINGQTWTGVHAFPSTVSIGNVDATEISYLDGVTSPIQGQFNTLGSVKSNKAGDSYTGSHDFTGATYVRVPTPSGLYDAVTKQYVDNLSFSVALPGQAGNAGKFVKTNGSVATWEYVAGVAPIGTMLPIGGQATNPYQPGDGSTWLRSGTIALSSVYPSAPKTLYAIAAGSASGSGAPVFGNGKFVCVSATSINVSTDLFNWVSYFSFPSGSQPIGAIGSTWVFANLSTQQCWTTTDFVNFTAVAALPAIFTKAKVVNGVIFGFLSSSSICYTSTDVINWTARTLPSSQNWSDVAYTGTTYVMTASSFTGCAVATALGSWSAGGTLTSVTGSSSIAFGNSNTLLQVSASSATYNYSTNNGTTWTSGTFPTITGAYSPIWTGTKFIVSPNSSVAFATSATGVTFTEVAATSVGSQAGVSINLPISSCTDGAGKAFFGSGTTALFTTDHAVNFYRNGQINIGGQNDKSAGSPTAAVMTRYNTDFVSLIDKSGNALAVRQVASGITNAGEIAYNGVAWVVTNQGSTAARRSTDRINWSSVTLTQVVAAGANNISSFAAVGANFVGVNGSTTGTRSSDNGLNFSSCTFPGNISNLTSNGSLFLGWSSGTTYYTSPDGATGNWTARSFPLGIGSISNLCFDGARWCFYASNSNSASGFSLYTSTDGINWTSRDFPAESTATRLVSNLMSGGVIYLLNSASNTNPFITKDGGLSWCFASTSSNIYTDTSVIPIYGGFCSSSSSWNDVSVDFCGYAVRQQVVATNPISPTYYMRVA